MATDTCPQAAVADVLVKTALVGALLCVGYTWATNEGVFGKDLGTRAAKYAAGHAKGFFIR